MKTLPRSTKDRVRTAPELLDAPLPVGVPSIAVGGFHNHQIGAVRRLRVDQDGRIRCAEVPGKEDRPAGFVILQADEAGSQNVTGAFQFEAHTVGKIEGFTVFKAPRKVVDVSSMVLSAMLSGHRGKLSWRRPAWAPRALWWDGNR